MRPMGKRLMLSDANDIDRRLLLAAQEVSANAYAPYSGFAVGAAVLTRVGNIHLGANLENASYGLSLCAEIAAITAANSAGEHDIEAIAVVGHKFTPPPDSVQIVTPCGRCRQILFEASQVSGTDIKVFSSNGDLTGIVEAKISELLPDAFGPKNLSLDKNWPEMRAALLKRVECLRESVEGTANASAHRRMLTGRH
jgi:cytidine deaminase